MQERYAVELTPAELELVEVGLTMLLKAEDDATTIEQIKDLLPRLRAARPRGVADHESSLA